MSDDQMTRTPRDYEDAFEAYVGARRSSLLGQALLISGDRHTAEDLVQIALLRLYESWDKVRDLDLVDGYVRRIIANEHHSMWRRPSKKREFASSVMPDKLTDGSKGSNRGHDTALWTYVQTLPTRQRAVVALRYYEERTVRETAQILGITVGTVKSQTSRALATLRAQVDDQTQRPPGHAAVA